MINWIYFPKSKSIHDHLKQVINVFQKKLDQISCEIHKHSNNFVLEKVRLDLGRIDYKLKDQNCIRIKLKFPVLFGRNGIREKYFNADGFQIETKTVIEVEAGRGVTNYQFLKVLFQACMMHEVDFDNCGKEYIFEQ